MYAGLLSVSVNLFLRFVIKSLSTQPANIGPQEVPKTSPSNVPKMSPKDPI